MIERVELAPGFSISRILTGLWQVADMERDGAALDAAAAAESMKPYVDAGLTSFDMADHYGSSEIIAGTYRRSAGAGAVELLTKWVPKPGPVTRDSVREAVQRALDRMQMDRLDLLQFHAWSYPDPGWLDCMFYLQELKEEGLIGHLGLTNFDTAHLRMLLHSGVEVVSNQVCYSLVDQRAGGGMADLCAEHGVKILAFGTVAGGFLTERWLGIEEPSLDALGTWSQMKYKRFIDAAGGWSPFQGLLRVVHEVAGKHDVSMANVACRYMLEQPAVGGIIVGARLGASEHVADNVRLSEFTLDAEDHAAIAAAQAELSAIPGDCGDEYRKPPFLTAAGDLSDHFDAFPAPYPTERGSDGRTKALSGTIWEDLAGFSRAVRKGNRIFVSGTTATHGDRLIGGSDPEAQAHFCLDKLEGAIQSLGGRLEDVVRTRIYVHREDVAEAVSRAHGARMGEIQPANTLVRAGLIGEGYLVEMEAEAVVGS
jgi:aryl-alcohol dehydrogenase-like predicted oxidoreductase/enamine deaminase RidA (YjgF/YER057c/UK114 family)